jgi:hypothetical protein
VSVAWCCSAASSTGGRVELVAEAGKRRVGTRNWVRRLEGDAEAGLLRAVDRRWAQRGGFTVDCRRGRCGQRLGGYRVTRALQGQQRGLAGDLPQLRRQEARYHLRLAPLRLRLMIADDRHRLPVTLLSTSSFVNFAARRSFTSP